MNLKYAVSSKIRWSSLVKSKEVFVHLPGPVEEQVSHAQEHLQLVEPPKQVHSKLESPVQRVEDLGSHMNMCICTVVGWTT